jgi:hypothetical protein
MCSPLKGSKPVMRMLLDAVVDGVVVGIVVGIIVVDVVEFMLGKPKNSLEKYCRLKSQSHLEFEL